MYLLKSPITSLAGIGPKKAEAFGVLGIKTIRDLLMHYPFRYENFSQLRPIRQWEHGETVAYLGKITHTQTGRTRRGQTIFKALLTGAQGDLIALWFGRWNLENKLKVGHWLFCVGRTKNHYHQELHVTRHVRINSKKELQDLLRIEPVYWGTERLNSRQIASAMKEALAQLAEGEQFLTAELEERFGLMPLNRAIGQIHFPENSQALQLARRTLVIYELLMLILWAQSEHQYAHEGYRHCAIGDLTQSYLAALPYQLTTDQEAAVKEIWDDMAKPQQMHRLLQGDVGSGKTTVAVLSLLRAVANGYQGAFMAPTEILARQHYEKMATDMAQLGVRIKLLVGSTSRSERNLILEELANGRLHLIIGTHALLEPDVQFQQLSCVVIDEQHRFGVRQRLSLEEKGEHPDLLVMTATPIPRSLALTVYGDLNLTVIKSLPPGRKPVQTFRIRENKRKDMYEFLRKEVAQGHQAYVVCPLIDESEKMDLANAVALTEQLKQVFPEYEIRLLYGRMSADDKAETMAAFSRGEVHILVSTTVIEVGIDVSNATIMIIENAERFGLAQLHQLRGRIGRGAAKSYCILISETDTAEGSKRLETMVSSADGFAIAEADLALRGPGELLGLRQHGNVLFKLADPVKDAPLVSVARDLASAITKSEPYSPVLKEALLYTRKKMSP